MQSAFDTVVPPPYLLSMESLWMHGCRLPFWIKVEGGGDVDEKWVSRHLSISLVCASHTPTSLACGGGGGLALPRRKSLASSIQCPEKESISLFMLDQTQLSLRITIYPVYLYSLIPCANPAFRLPRSHREEFVL